MNRNRFSLSNLWIIIAGLMLISYFVVMVGGNTIRIYRQGERVAFSTNFIQELFFYLWFLVGYICFYYCTIGNDLVCINNNIGFDHGVRTDYRVGPNDGT